MAFVSLPEQVSIAPSSIPGVQLGVFSTCWIKEGTQMGPYTGRIVKVEELSSDVDNSLMWEVSQLLFDSLVNNVMMFECYHLKNYVMKRAG